MRNKDCCKEVSFWHFLKHASFLDAKTLVAMKIEEM